MDIKCGSVAVIVPSLQVFSEDRIVDICLHHFSKNSQNNRIFVLLLKFKLLSTHVCLLNVSFKYQLIFLRTISLCKTGVEGQSP